MLGIRLSLFCQTMLGIRLSLFCQAMLCIRLSLFCQAIFLIPLRVMQNGKAQIHLSDAVESDHAVPLVGGGGNHITFCSDDYRYYTRLFRTEVKPLVPPGFLTFIEPLSCR